MGEEISRLDSFWGPSLGPGIFFWSHFWAPEFPKLMSKREEAANWHRNSPLLNYGGGN